MEPQTPPQPQDQHQPLSQPLPPTPPNPTPAPTPPTPLAPEGPPQPAPPQPPQQPIPPAPTQTIPAPTPDPAQGTSNAPGAASGSQLKPVDKKLLNLFEQDADEVLIGQINKHPIGLVFIYAGALIMFLAILILVYLTFRYLPTVGFDVSPYQLWIKLLFGLLSFFILLGGYVAGWVYMRSALILTSEKLVQLSQKNLIDRKISQLAIGDIQDVTVDQTGILSRIFHYGSINIETSGEQYNYSFDYAYPPHDVAKEIISAHERNVQLYGN